MGRLNWVGHHNGVVVEDLSIFEGHSIGNDKDLHAFYLVWNLRGTASAPLKSVRARPGGTCSWNMG